MEIEVLPSPLNVVIKGGVVRETTVVNVLLSIDIFVQR
jgi:uncharacterized membrane protein YqaE (UPF0057 family)